MSDESTEIQATDHPPGRGLYDCDDAYRTPVRSDYERIFDSSLVILDANVLLNLYRSNERTRNDMFTVLRKVNNRLWIPNQVLAEFWRNRDLPSVRGHHHTKARETCGALDKASRSIGDALTRWLKDVHLSNNEEASERVKKAKEAIAESLSELKTFIQDQAEIDALEGTAATTTDPVLHELEPILQGRVGEPFNEELYAETIKEAKQRADKRIPPGYEDFENKTEEKAAGDYIVWSQIINEAEKQRCDVLLVTGDTKDDWWIPGNGQRPARPRTELRVELKQRANSELYMLTPSQLLVEADRIFALAVDERSVSDLATSESGSFRARLPKNLTRGISRRLQRAHQRAIKAAKATGKGSTAYSSLLSILVLDELNKEVTALGGTSLRLASLAYPVLNGYLLYPFRYAKHPTPLYEAENYLLSPAVRRKLDRFANLHETAPDPLLDSSIIYAIEKAAFEERIVAIPYTSNSRDGITSIHWGTCHIDPDNGVQWEHIERLNLEVNIEVE